MFPRYLAPGVCRGLLAAIIFTLALLVPLTATAQTSAAERAAQLNEEGKKLWTEQDDLPGAVKKFRQATVLSPEGRYYFNLCYALHQLGRYRDALTACEAVEPNTSDAGLVEKTNVVLDDLRQRLPPETAPPPDTYPDPDDAQDPATGDPQDPNDYQDPDYQDPDYQDGDQGYGSEPPPGPLPGLQEAAGPTDDYAWSLGGELGFVANGLGDDDRYGGAGGILKLQASFMWLSEQRIGVQPYLHISQIGSAADTATMSGEALQIIDIGGAIFKHFSYRNMYLTPLVGAHVSGLQAELGFEPVVKVGLRAEVGVAWLLGESRNHVISVTPTLNVYSATTGVEAIDSSLVDGGVTLALTAGYTLRFTTPFSRTTLITLE